MLKLTFEVEEFNFLDLPTKSVDEIKKWSQQEGQHPKLPQL
jgi:hypothetical protein